jgi:ubiquinone/menaquinone biosynthesis C-methylase UbiE
MSESWSAISAQDPMVPDWQTVILPDAWPDRLDFRRPTDLWRVLTQPLRRHRPPVDVPAKMPGADMIPRYVLQEFHNLPNGNYSKRLTRGYITGFERVMLGTMGSARREVAAKLSGMNSVLDVGCAGGKMAHALREAGVEDVWGLDPSPYLLQHGANDFPQVKFVQGVAEQTTFADARFDGVTACFLMHELPPRYIDHALEEFSRIVKPGGRLAFIEPSRVQRTLSLPALLFKYGVRGLYFGLLARLLHEPFLNAWHKQDIGQKLAEFGFQLVEDRDELPVRRILATRNAA